MSNIEQNVVQMTFDNSNFEKNVQTSMLSLDNLKASLNLGNAASGLASSIQTISGRFSTMGIIGVTALQNITNSAINTGKRMLASLTIDPVKTGLSEYEEKINSIQTILMGAKNADGTAVSLEQVKEKLEELNTYSDKTIYSFKDMTSNIGKFTNAGVDLDTAVKAIQGVANEAAVSGANAQQASHAMYNFSQALSAGYVKLIDWKSIENAGMATQEFKQQLLDSAVAAGTVKKTADGMYEVLTKNGQGSNMKETINATKNFNDSLGYQWMTTEVLTSTLSKYTDETTAIGKKAFAAATEVKTFTQLLDTLREAAQSGWALTWEYIIGDFNEAKKLWTAVNNEISAIIDANADERNALVKGWKELGGRDILGKGIVNVWTSIKTIASDVQEAFRDIFPPMTSKQLLNLTKGFEHLTDTISTFLTLNSGNLTYTFRGIFAALDIGVQLLSGFVRAIRPLVGSLLPKAASGFLETTGSIGDFITSIDKTIKKNDIFYKTFKKIVDFIMGSTPFKVLSDGLGNLSSVFDTVFGKLSGFIGKIKEFFTNLTSESENSVSKTSGVFTTLFNILSLVGTALKNTAKTIGDAFTKAFEGFNADSAQGLVNGGILTAIALGIKKFVDLLTGSAKDLTGLSVVKSIKETLSGVQEAFQSFQQNMKAGSLLKIATAIGVLALSLVVLSGIDSEKMGNAVAGITALFADLIGSLLIFEQLSSGTGMKGISMAATAMTKLSVSVLILSMAMKKISDIPADQLGNSVAAIAGLSAILVGTAVALDRFGGKKAAKAAKGMITMSIAVNILAIALDKLGQMNPDQMAQGLGGVGALLAEVAAFLVVAKYGKLGVTTGAAILIIAESLKVLTGVVSVFGEMNIDQLKQGMIAIGALLAMFGAFAKFTSGSKGILGSSVALVIMAEAIKMLVAPLSSFGSMSLDQISNSIIMLAASLAALVISARAMSGAVAGAAAMLIMSVALNALTPVLMQFSQMSLTEIAKALGVLAGSLAIFGAAGYLLAPVAPILLLIAGAMALFGIGITAVGAGILMLSAGLTAFAGALAANVASIVASIGIAVAGLVGFVPMVATAIAQGILIFATTLLAGTAQLVPAAVALGMAILNGIKTLAPMLIEVAFLLITSLMQGIADNIERIVVLAGDIVTGFINGLAVMLPQIVEAGTNFIISLIDSMAVSIDTNGPRIINAFRNIFASLGGLILEVIATIAEHIPGVGSTIANALRGAKTELTKNLNPGDAKKKATAYKKGASEGVKGLSDEVGKEAGKASKNFGKELDNGDAKKKAEKVKKDAIKAISGLDTEYSKEATKANKALSSGLSGESGDIKNATNKLSKSAKIKVKSNESSKEGEKLGTEFSKGISKSEGKVKKASESIASKGASGAKSKRGEFYSAGSYTASGLLSGLESKRGALYAKGASLASSFNSGYKNNLHVHSPSRVMMWNGQMTVLGLIKGIDKSLPSAAASAKSLAVSVKDAMVNQLSAVAEAFDQDLSYEPVISPVLDLGNVHSGLSSLNKSLGAKRTLSVSPMVVDSSPTIARSISEIQNGASTSDVVNAISKLRNDIGNIQANNYNVNGITYDDGSNIVQAIETLVRETIIEGRA